MAKAVKIDALNCRAAATTGAKLILETRFGEMWALREAALDWGDPEGVHNMRVASRRLRSAMQDFAPHLPSLKLKKAEKNVRGVARALGQVRDADVRLIALDELLAEAPEDFRAGVAAIAAARRAERETHREALMREINADTAEAARQLWATTWESQVAVGVSPNEKTLIGTGRAVISDRWDDLLKLSRSLYRPFEIEPLHEMRIMAKRLRYALELFSACWGDALDPFAADVAKIQSGLGDVHDCDEWIAELSGELRRHHRGRRLLAPDQVRAAHHLLGVFARKRARAYAASLMIWEEWEHTHFSANLRAAITAEV